MLNRKTLNYCCLFLLAVTMILFACRNPFESDPPEIKDLPAEDFNGTGVQVITDDEKNDKADVSSDDKGSGTLVLQLGTVIEEIQIINSFEGKTVTLSVTNEYEKYEWYMADNLITTLASCELDFSCFVQNMYPVVLYAFKNGKMYSGMVYICYDGENFLINDNFRTILPQFFVTSFTDISVVVKAAADDSTNLFSFKNYSDFKTKRYSIKPGIYNLEVTAQLNQLKFRGETKIEISEGLNRVDVIMQRTDLDLQEVQKTGALKLDVNVNWKYELDFTELYLYKKEGDEFDLVDYADSKNGKMEVKTLSPFEKSIQYNVVNLVPGVYWLRINVGNNVQKMYSYYADFVYIDSEITSYKEVKIDSFFTMYSIEYDYTGGFYTGDNYINKLSSFDTLVLPDKTNMIKYKNVFSGWYFDSAFTEKCPETITPGLINKNIKLYAAWTAGEDSLPFNTSLIKSAALQVDYSDGILFIKMPSPESMDLYIMDLTDSYGETYGIKAENIIIQENSLEISAILPSLDENLYTITLLGYKENLLSVHEKQLIKLSTN